MAGGQSVAFTLILKILGRGAYGSLHRTRIGTHMDCEDPCVVIGGKNVPLLT
jgi:hypothetical protein